MDTPWTKYYGDDINEITVTEANMYELFTSCVDKYPDSIAISYSKSKFSYRKLLDEVNRYASSFIKIGFKKGDILSIVSPMLPSVVIASLAVNKIGAIISIIDSNATDSQINKMLKESESRYLLILKNHRSHLSKITKDTSIDTVIFNSDTDYLNVIDKVIMALYKHKFDDGIEGGLDSPSGVSIHTWIELGRDSNKDEDIDVGEITSSDKALYLHHSSLLNEKGIECFTNEAIIYACKTIKYGYNLEQYAKGHNKVMCSMNYSYSGTFVFAYISMLCAGIEVICIPYHTDETFVSTIFIHKPNIIIGYPVTFTSMVEVLTNKYPVKRLDFLKFLIAAGTSFVSSRRASCEEYLKRRGCESGISVCYGLAECLSTCSFVPEDTNKNNSLGIPFPGVNMKIIDPKTQREVSAGEKGEICICHQGVMSEVLNDDVMTAKILKKHMDGRMWVHTGDIGHKDEDGFFYFDYVEKRCAKIDGVSVSLRHVEDVIKAIYGVFDCCVVDYCNELCETKLVALVIPIESYLLDNDKLTDLMSSIENECEMMLPPNSRPDEVEYRVYLPKIGSNIDYKSITNEVTEKRLSK